MAKQGDDREPVGECAHHRRFCESGDDAEHRIAALESAREQIDEGDEHEQCRRDPLDPCQCGLFFLLSVEEGIHGLHFLSQWQAPYVNQARSTYLRMPETMQTVPCDLCGALVVGRSCRNRRWL